MDPRDEETFARFVQRYSAIDEVVPAPRPIRGRSAARSRLGGIGVAAMLAAAGIVVALVGRGPSSLATPTAPGSPMQSPRGGSPDVNSPRAAETLDVDGLSIDVPPGWQVVRPHVWDPRFGPRAFLSNAPIADPCPTSAADDDTCWRPLSTLPRGGILVTVGTVENPHLPMPTPTTRTLAPDITCAELHGDETLTAVFRPFALNACVSGPALDEAAEIFRKIVDSAVVALPSAPAMSLPPGISRDQAVNLARSHVGPDVSFVEADAGPFAALDAHPSGTGPGSDPKPSDLVWAITYSAEFTICPPGGTACESPRPGYVVVYLDYRSGAFLMSEGVSPAP
jgi:hypothetical protein